MTKFLSFDEMQALNKKLAVSKLESCITLLGWILYHSRGDSRIPYDVIRSLQDSKESLERALRRLK